MKKKYILLIGAAAMLGGCANANANAIVVKGLKMVMAEELVKNAVKVGVEGMQKLVPIIRNRINPPPPPGLIATIEQTLYQFESTVQYPHQPVVREYFQLRTVASGPLVTHKVWTNGVLGRSESRPLRYYSDLYAKDPTSVPFWMRQPLLNHLNRRCDFTLNGQTFPNRSEETYELVIRCRGENWPKQSPPSRAFVTVEVPQELVFNRCFDASVQINAGSDAAPQYRRNGELTRDRYVDVSLLLDPTGKGYSTPIVPTGIPNRLEPTGQPPLLRRCSLTPTSIANADKQ